MRVVLDTNTLVAAFLSSSGPHRRILELGIAGRFSLHTSETLLAELADVFSRSKFAGRLAAAGLTAEGIVNDVRLLSHLETPDPDFPPTILDDPDDDAVLACADTARATLIVSGDHHLLDLRAFRGMSILPPTEALAVLAGLPHP